MIAAADPVVNSQKLRNKSFPFLIVFSLQDFIPSGRSVITEHCGPLTKKNDFASNEFILLDRMQNVNLSVDEHFNESWVLREVLHHQNSQEDEEDLAFLTPCVVNSEEELYFSGHTAVWSRGREKSSADICYTTENSILFAQFCSPNFLNPDYKIDDKETAKGKSNFNTIEENQGIAIIDCNSLKVYSRNGENIVTALECPVRKIWTTKYCVLIEKDASTSIVDGHSVPMPRFFSLTHPLDEMFPVLLKSQNFINFIVEDEYKVR
jgi:anaphase-promoting complex subunit 1